MYRASGMGFPRTTALRADDSCRVVLPRWECVLLPRRSMAGGQHARGISLPGRNARSCRACDAAASQGVSRRHPSAAPSRGIVMRTPPPLGRVCPFYRGVGDILSDLPGRSCACVPAPRRCRERRTATPGSPGRTSREHGSGRRASAPAPAPDAARLEGVVGLRRGNPRAALRRACRFTSSVRSQGCL